MHHTFVLLLDMTSYDFKVGPCWIDMVGMAQVTKRQCGAFRLGRATWILVFGFRIS